MWQCVFVAWGGGGDLCIVDLGILDLVLHMFLGLPPLLHVPPVRIPRMLQGSRAHHVLIRDHDRAVFGL